MSVTSDSHDWPAQTTVWKMCLEEQEGGKEESKRTRGERPSLYPLMHRAKCTASALVFVGDKGDASSYSNEAN
jgi:hypothetical protein